jgi:hypothetical protein
MRVGDIARSRQSCGAPPGHFRSRLEASGSFGVDEGDGKMPSIESQMHELWSDGRRGDCGDGRRVALLTNVMCYVFLALVMILLILHRIGGIFVFLRTIVG